MSEQENKMGGEAPCECAAPEAQAEAERKPKKASKTAAAAAALEQKLADAALREADLEDRLLRTAAEYDNYRRRTRIERESAFGHGVAHAAAELLPVLDTLEMAAEAPSADEEYRKGVLLTLGKCREVFEKLGISEIEALGLPFNPELHDACMQEASETAASGEVTRVMKKGYTQNGRVVRHAVVAVAV